jgi:phage head maturation protease
VSELLTFDGLTAASFSIDAQRRTLTGVVVPWGAVGRHRNGRRWRFARGSLKFGDAKYIRLNEEHVHSAKLGRAVFAEDTDEGLVVTFRVYDGRDGDRALAMAQDGIKTGFSVEIEFDEADSEPDPENPGALLVNMANLTAVGFVKDPAFTDARLISVRANEEGTGMDPETTTTEETPAAAPQPVTLTSEQFSVLMSRIGEPESEQRPTVDPTRTVGRQQTPAAEVTEPVPYRFSRTGVAAYHFANTEHDLSKDLLTIAKSAAEHTSPGAALDRVNDFVRQSFADVEIADVPGTRAAQLRPDMWVPQRDYATPLWDLVGRGPIDEMPFYVPKFTSASGLVAAATEKTEPAGGSFVDELQTITPGQLWGKVEITRQLWRSPGTPALSGILWDQMLRSFFEAREAAIATFLNTLTAAADITLTGTPATTPDNDDDQVTVGDLETALADLNFARGGQRFTGFAAHQAIYRVLARVKDDAGRPLYPQIAPQNANGTTASRYRTIEIGGTTAVPAYALGTVSTTATNSWLFDPAVVMSWAGAPERLYWDFGATVQTAAIPQLSFVTLGLYANYANANTDITGVRQVIFDPSV